MHVRGSDRSVQATFGFCTMCFCFNTCRNSESCFEKKHSKTLNQTTSIHSQPSATTHLQTTPTAIRAVTHLQSPVFSVRRNEIHLFQQTIFTSTKRRTTVQFAANQALLMNLKIELQSAKSFYDQINSRSHCLQVCSSKCPGCCNRCKGLFEYCLPFERHKNWASTSK